MAKKKVNEDDMKFEDALKGLEEIAERLENGDMGLEESINAYELGMKYSKLCHKRLEEAERKIEILQKGDSGKVASKEVAVKSDTGEIEEDDDFQGSLL